MVTPSPKSIDSTSRWPSRLARWTLYAAIPLVLFGGTVTTMRAGMAEDGWWTPDGHLLWLYPWAMRIRNAGVFVEHHHRELGSLVGLLSLVTVIATWCFEKRWGARLLALAGLTAVSVQGAIGGFRVLENDPQLAFLHGALGQAVFTLLAVVAIGLSAAWRSARGARWGQSGASRPSVTAPALLTLGLVYGQAVVGAWLRHGHHPMALVLHIAMAFAAVAAILLTGKRLKAAAADLGESDSRGRLERAATRMHALLGTQILLGLGATLSIYQLSGGMRSAEIHPAELIFATAHVAVGALLLASIASAAMWSACLAPRSAEGRSRAARSGASPQLAKAEGGTA